MLARLLILLAFILGLGAPAGAEPNYMDRMLILDMSGSMWKKLPKGQRRLDVAKTFGTAMAAATARGQPEAALGLTVFGTKGKEEFGCNDIETLVQPRPFATAPSQLGGLIEAIAGLDPKPYSKTPLMESLQRASRSLPDGGAVILVSDLEETCSEEQQTSPCEVFAQLKSDGQLFDIEVYYVVAVAGADDDVSGMRAFGQCTGADFVRVDTSDDAEALAEDIATALLRRSRRLDVTLRLAMEPAPDIPPAWGAVPLDGRIALSGPESKSWVIDGEAKVLSLRSGRYLAQASIGGTALSQMTVDVAGGLPNEVVFRVAAGRLVLSATGPEGESLGAETITWTVTAADGRQIPAKTGPNVVFDLPPGRYSVEAASSLGGYRGELALGIGTTQPQAVMLDAGLATAPKGLLLYRIREGVPSLFKDLSGRAAVSLSDDAGRSVTLPADESRKQVEPGRYEVAVAWEGQRAVLAPLEIADLQPVTAEFDIPPSIIEATAGVPGKQVIWRLRRTGGGQIELAGAKLHQTVPPGTYEIVARDGQREQSVTRTLGIGQFVQVTLDLH